LLRLNARAINCSHCVGGRARSAASLVGPLLAERAAVSPRLFVRRQSIVIAATAAQSNTRDRRSFIEVRSG